MPQLTQFSRAGRDATLACALVALAALVGGCAIVGFFGRAVFPEQVKAAYQLQDRPTIVIVDDPANFLDDQGLVHEIAHLVGIELIQHRVLREVVPGAKLVQFATRLGNQYARMPIDRVGTQLNAEQVLHVNIESVSVGHMQLTIVCSAKVIDAQQSIRLFPSPRHGKTASTPSPIGLVTAELIHRPIMEMGPGARAMINRDLARRVSVEVAQLFYDHEVPKRSEAFHQSSS